MRCLKWVFTIMFAFTLTSCAINSLNLKQGIYNFKNQDYRAAFIRLMPEAEKGNPDAQYAIGYMYYYGEGVVEDKQKAMKWIKAAAHQGQEDAMTALRLIRKSEQHSYSKNV